MRAAGVPGRGEKGKTWRWVRPQSSTIDEAVLEHRLALGREAGDEIGAEDDVGAQAADVGGEAHGVGAQMPALHALEDHVVAVLEREMEMRHQPLLLGDGAHQLVVHLDRIDGGKAQALQFRHMAEDGADQPGRGRACPAGRRPRR